MAKEYATTETKLCRAVKTRLIIVFVANITLVDSRCVYLCLQ